MELGSWAEWVTGFAELSAVVTTLFFSFYKDYQDRKKDTQATLNFLRMMCAEVITSFTRIEQTDNTLTDENKETSKAYTTFRYWVQIRTLIAESDKQRITDTANQILVLFQQCTTVDDVLKSRVQQSIQSLSK